MTAPFAPPPPKILSVIIAWGVVFTLAAPFARRPGWIGQTATLAIALSAAVLWGMVGLAVFKSLVRRPDREDRE